MGNKKIKIIWGLNVILFVAVVYMGINQAGLGAQISLLEDDVQVLLKEKNDISEKVLLGNSSVSITDNSLDLGFDKPQNIVYIDSEDIFASLLVR